MKLFPTTRDDWQHLSRLWFFGAIGWFVLGFLITFYPGVEQGYFTTAACLFLLCFLIYRGGYRIAAAAFLLLSVLFAISGHQRGVRYQAWLAKREPLPVAAPRP
jgi:cytochrome c biogenesis protein CcdA